ncbi:hypothetical protein J437_LFUL016185, partial [Ladona fulva]
MSRSISNLFNANATDCVSDGDDAEFDQSTDTSVKIGFTSTSDNTSGIYEEYLKGFGKESNSVKVTRFFADHKQKYRPPPNHNKLHVPILGILYPTFFCKTYYTYYAAAVDSWHKYSPGKVFSIYRIAGCVNVAPQKAMTPTTIINGFYKTEIHPFNRHIFSKEDFLSSSVTNQPLPEETVHEPLKHVLTAFPNSPLKNGRTENEENQKCLKSPADFKGYPKG